MAMVSAVPEAHVRGTFMTLISSVQMLSSGLATLIAGLIITRTPDGMIEHYDTVGYLGSSLRGTDDLACTAPAHTT